jgi:N-acetyl-anhydromuramyl-L-alanine amidase AmpD
MATPLLIDQAVRSPNYSLRGGHSISMIVLHATVGSARSALAWLTNPAPRVSAHYLIDKSGHIYQLVADEYCAWHAGRASWHDQTAINELSLGIELENANDGRDVYPPAQIGALQQLVQAKVTQYRIAPDMITRHMDIAVPRGRKTDPAGFPWVEFIGQLFPQVPPPDNRTPRPMPNPQPTFAQKLLAEAYRQAGAASHQDWAMARVAKAESLGMPIGPFFEVIVANRSYTVQSFARDALFSTTGDWQRVQRFTALTSPEQQPLRTALIQGMYRQAGETYHPEWAFHQYALRNPIGPPLSPSFRITVAKQEFRAECYALDVIYNPGERWSEIGRLSQLLAGGQQPELANALQEHWSSRAGRQLRTEWPLYQYALREKLGAPIGSSFRVTDSGHDFVAESFALDVIACEIGSWKTITRLSTL